MANTTTANSFENNLESSQNGEFTANEEVETEHEVIIMN